MTDDIMIPILKNKYAGTRFRKANKAELAAFARQRECAILRDVGRKTYKEIGDRIGVSPARARTLCAKGRRSYLLENVTLRDKYPKSAIS